MTSDHIRALVLVGALATGGSFIGSRGPAPAIPAPPVERLIKLPPAAPLGQAHKPPPAEVKPPLPVPRPKIEVKPKPKPEAKRPRQAKKALPSCEYIRREKARMSWSEQWAEYQKATPAEIAHGKRCLGY